MKRAINKIVILSLVTVTLSGCFLKSVHPLINNDNAVLIEGLEGVYEKKDQRWTFASDNTPYLMADLIREHPDEDISLEPGEIDTLGKDGYLIRLEQLDKPGSYPEYFIGMIGKINGDLFLNLKLLELDYGMNSSFGIAHQFNVNTFSKFQFSGEELIMEPFASSWIRDQIRNNRVRIKHEVVTSDFDESSEVLITASTEELQQFVKKYGNEEEAYEEAITLRRIDNEAQ
ncbi:MAG TPA: hypothetical protein VFM80_06765 [Gracilimonas sp.]|uniref:hypothetical protein n=1 Tax=Gracilimonas sp. TaxID=1974203 RepID=UPI002D9A9DCD|nr:hypothetical protein [Gracilimonas sp.]